MNRRNFIKKSLEGIIIAGGIVSIPLISGCVHNPFGSERETLVKKLPTSFYLPLNVGNSWTYIDGNGSTKTFNIIDTEEINGNTYFKFDDYFRVCGFPGFLGSEQQLFRYDPESDKILQYWCSKDKDIVRYDWRNSALQFQIGNSIWYRLGFQVEQEFIDINQTYFDAEVAGLNFSNQSAITTINNWVNQKTNGKITEIIDEIKPEIVMFLINAIYFKGDWTIQFDPAKTHDGDFYLLDGSKKTVKMMTQKNDFAYYFHQDFQAIDLPYGGQAFSMTIFLPDADVDIDDFIAQINNENLSEWIGDLHEIELYLSMPKFKLEYDLTLNDVLKALGMEIAFDPSQADFYKISQSVFPERLYIDEVKHKTFVDVNEEGTEAAAVTSVSIGLTAAPQSMTVDRPFVFVIREKFSNTILFMGKIVEPVLE